MQIEKCTMQDFNEIILNIADFWGNDRTLYLHHPYLIHEFGNTAYVIHDKGKVIAYMFAFFAQTEKLGYVHLLGIRENYQRKGIGKLLYENFINVAKAHGCTKIKAITTPGNQKSINFHQKQIGMKLLGTPDSNGTNIIKDYSGPGSDRVVFMKEI
jgi:N-acetylglutamate synthase and related acetyltransferases